MTTKLPPLILTSFLLISRQSTAVIAILIPLRSNVSKLECLDLTSPYILDWSGRTVLIDHVARMLISNVHLLELHLAKIGLDDFELDRLLIGLEA